MRPARLVTVAAATAMLALAPAAFGASRVCNLVADPQGDTHHFPNHPTPADSYVSKDLDIVGGDIASNRLHLTAVIRLVSLREADPESPTGRTWGAVFTVGSTTYKLQARYAANGHSATAWNETTGAGIGNAGVVLDEAAREVRISAPLAYFGLKPGQQVTGITLTAGQFYGTGPVSAGLPVDFGAYAGSAGADSALDTATTTKSYRAGTASCVAVGR
jgi:hypothetical protein